jgi:Bacterial transcriptional activator domain
MCDDCKKEPRKGSDCWPDDKDYLDGSTEIFLPSEKYLKAYWDCDIIDDKNPQDTIIESNEAFQVRFRVELKGRLWKCICGHWCFDLCFTAIGDGEDFNLSDVLPDDLKPDLRICDWQGCQTRCIDKTITVPAGTIPAGYCGTLYQVGAKFELRWLLMRCYASDHKQQLVSRQYSICVKALRDELGVSPGAETIRLFHDLTSVS